jgi:hypothetical protein
MRALSVAAARRSAAFGFLASSPPARLVKCGSMVGPVNVSSVNVSPVTVSPVTVSPLSVSPVRE